MRILNAFYDFGCEAMTFLKLTSGGLVFYKKLITGYFAFAEPLQSLFDLSRSPLVLFLATLFLYALVHCSPDQDHVQQSACILRIDRAVVRVARKCKYHKPWTPI